MCFAWENNTLDILFSAAFLNFSDNKNANLYLNGISYITLVAMLACLWSMPENQLLQCLLLSNICQRG